jgi:hypothetical protein
MTLLLSPKGGSINPATRRFLNLQKLPKLGRESKKPADGGTTSRIPQKMNPKSQISAGQLRATDFFDVQGATYVLTSEHRTWGTDSVTFDANVFL